MLLIAGEHDHTVPWAIANASYKKQRRNAAVTEIVQIDGPWALPHDRRRVAARSPTPRLAFLARNDA